MRAFRLPQRCCLAARARRTRAGGNARLLLLVAALCGACTPIPARAPSEEGLLSGARENQPDPATAGVAGGLFDYYPDAHRLNIGERAPDARLRDRSDRAISLSDFRGSVVVLTFIGASDDNDNDAEMLRRLTELGNSFGPNLAGEVHLLTLVLDDASDSPAVSRAHDAAPAVNVPWTFVGATPGEAARFAASFGVVVWQYADGNVGHNFNTVVIDPTGRFVDQFPGLDPWSPRDVVAAASVAAGR